MKQLVETWNMKMWTLIKRRSEGKTVIFLIKVLSLVDDKDYCHTKTVGKLTPPHPSLLYNMYATLFLCSPLLKLSCTDQTCPSFASLSVTALNYENVVETGSETEEEDKLPVSEEDPLINGTGSPASLTNPEASPRAESHGLLTKEEEDDEMRDSGVEHIWPDNDMLSASVDGTGECLE